ncbi:cap-specific mRNA (nucleoside-2'-o-)-methyltransferase 1 [Anaeramoeba flamelloides]|uniref:Cap-specific mRNA (nucleoside-2'-O-)-methyltransferase 1 n=1 Tax=Anaeramoeba flamelloides TaxID=1746091 RepID=A0ABQ8Y2V1_9EUKA|nr:cap-specific mRNA (nucleoside-2'-o-)-methyltransferase 1 [Anaeramoeba flamelloides]
MEEKEIELFSLYDDQDYKNTSTESRLKPPIYNLNSKLNSPFLQIEEFYTLSHYGSVETENIERLEIKYLTVEDIPVSKPGYIDLEKYCNPDLVQKMWEIKNQLGGHNRKNLIKARTSINPFEKIGKAIFQNRAALKLANLDYLLYLIKKDRKCVFADICGGPGGFTEYIYWRKKGNAHGFGITLKCGDNDWKLESFRNDAPHDNFIKLYGKDQTGDLTKNENMKDFAKNVREQTNDKGVDIVVADGGFSVEDNPNLQEIYLQQLILCQFLTMFTVLNKGGSFVCKVFDLLHPFTVGLLYILSANFEKFSIVKPYSSRPANSEKYIVCQGLVERFPQDVLDYLFKINDRMNSSDLKNNNLHLQALVDESNFQNNGFLRFIQNTNIRLVERQIGFLANFVQALKNSSIQKHYDQVLMKEICLTRWNIPFEIPNSRKIQQNLLTNSTENNNKETELKKRRVVRRRSSSNIQRSNNQGILGMDNDQLLQSVQQYLQKHKKN